MKVGFFSYSLSGVGPRVRAQRIIEQLADDPRHDVVVVTGVDEEFAVTGAEIHNILSVRSLLSPTTFLRVRQIFSEVDVVHVPVNFHQLLYVWLSGVRPIVAGPGIQHDDRFRLAVKRMGIKKMIETHEFVSYLWNISGVDSTYVYPSVDTGRFSVYDADRREQIRDRLQIPRSAKVVLFVGTLSEFKGAPLVSELAKELSDNEIQTVVVGAGPLSATFENRRDLNYQGFVQNAELPDYYNIADVTIVPSESESFSIVSLESIACGTPVITTASEESAMARIFKDRQTYIWSDRTVSALFDSVSALLFDEEDYKTQVDRGFRTIEELGLTLDDSYEKFLDVYENVASQQRRG